MAMVTLMDDGYKYELVYDLSSGAISDELMWPVSNVGPYTTDIFTMADW